MSGATLRPAARCRWDGPDPGVCALCGREPATLDHLLWRCVALPNRPVTRNLGILQARFGWPSGRANDVAVLDWHVAVGAKILADRYA